MAAFQSSLTYGGPGMPVLPLRCHIYSKELAEKLLLAGARDR